MQYFQRLRDVDDDAIPPENEPIISTKPETLRIDKCDLNYDFSRKWPGHVLIFTRFNLPPRSYTGNRFIAHFVHNKETL